MKNKLSSWLLPCIMALIMSLTATQSFTVVTKAEELAPPATINLVPVDGYTNVAEPVTKFHVVTTPEESDLSDLTWSARNFYGSKGYFRVRRQIC